MPPKIAPPKETKKKDKKSAQVKKRWIRSSSKKKRKFDSDASTSEVKAKKESLFTEEELDEDIDTTLTTEDPYMSKNTVEFDRKSDAFKPVFVFRTAVVYYKNLGSLKPKLTGPEAVLFGEEEAVAQEAEEEEKMRNKFNFRSVASQTPYKHPSERSNQTDSSLFPVLTFKVNFSKAEIVDTYKEKEEGVKKIDPYTWIPVAHRKIAKFVGQSYRRKAIADTNRRYLRLCERMLDQNMSEANLDFTYYDNPNDEFRAETGSLLPLWNIGCRTVRGMPVTGLCWNTQYPDLFAVAYKDPEKDDAEERGEDDLGMIFEKGCVCVFSLKGPSYPERIYVCPSAVRCLDFHPNRPYLVAMGFFGGTVAVYDLRREDSSPSGVSAKSEKVLHQDTVSEIQWLTDAIPQKFCSVSADGKIIKWQFMLHDLCPSEVVTSLLIRDILPEVPPKGIEMEKEPKKSIMEDVSLKVGGTTLSIAGDSFAVGTTTGGIVVGSLEEKASTWDHVDHKHSVRSVQWNPYHPDVFLSCGKDLTVRIWHRAIRTSVFEFFLEEEVVDARWAPFSSTLFAAISGNAVVHVFDLATNKTEAMGTYTVYTAKQSSRLTILRFHPFKPILMVGDDRGRVIVFKLSPNLRSSLKTLDTLGKDKYASHEKEKMEKLLSSVKGKTK